jgi:hypothetical protein
MVDIRKLILVWLTFASMTLLTFSCSVGAAYGQGAATPPVFFTDAQYQNFMQRNQLEPGSLASCTVPAVTITHSPGYVVPTTPPQTLYADLTATPHAACNDGTPAAFLFRPGYGVAASRWVIGLNGGGQCSQQTTCIQRQNTNLSLTSSQPFMKGKQITPMTGLLSPDPAQNPDFYDANLVQIAYCSSDDWMGDIDGNTAMTSAQIRASKNVSNWYFDGHGIIQGVIQLLQTDYGLNNASDVLFGGGSAGAIGVFMNVSFVSGLLPLQTRLVGLPDASFVLSSFPDYDPATGGETQPPTNYQIEMTQGQSLWGSIGDFGCAYASNQAGNGFNNLACDYPDMLAQNATYQTPLFIRESYHDDTLMSYYNVTFPMTPEETPYATDFDNEMYQALSATNVWLSVFGLNNDMHTMIGTTSYFSGKISTFPGGVKTTLAAAVGTWYSNPCAAPRWMQNPTPQ